MIFGDLLNYDVFLAEVESFSMLHSCITNLHTFQHGHPGYLGVFLKTSGLNDTSCSYEPYFLDFKNAKICKNISDFRLLSVKTEKHPTSFPLPDVEQCPCIYRNLLEIQPDYVISCLC